MHALQYATGCTSWICNNWTAGLTAAGRINLYHRQYSFTLYVHLLTLGQHAWQKPVCVCLLHDVYAVQVSIQRWVDPAIERQVNPAIIHPYLYSLTYYMIINVEYWLTECKWTMSSACLVQCSHSIWPNEASSRRNSCYFNSSSRSTWSLPDRVALWYSAHNWREGQLWAEYTRCYGRFP